MAYLLFHEYLQMDPVAADFETHFMGNILRKIDRHSLYHTDIL